jgi:pentatricopeptide repeat protein
VQAQEILVEAQSDGVKADVRTYTSIIKGAVRGDQMEQALSVLRDMDAAKVLPNVVRCRLTNKDRAPISGLCLQCWRWGRMGYVLGDGVRGIVSLATSDVL